MLHFLTYVPTSIDIVQLRYICCYDQLTVVTCVSIVTVYFRHICIYSTVSCLCVSQVR